MESTWPSSEGFVKELQFAHAMSIFPLPWKPGGGYCLGFGMEVVRTYWAEILKTQFLYIYILDYMIKRGIHVWSFHIIRTWNWGWKDSLPKGLLLGWLCDVPSKTWAYCHLKNGPRVGGSQSLMTPFWDDWITWWDPEKKSTDETSEDFPLQEKMFLQNTNPLLLWFWWLITGSGWEKISLASPTSSCNSSGLTVKIIWVH